MGFLTLFHQTMGLQTMREAELRIPKDMPHWDVKIQLPKGAEGGGRWDNGAGGVGGWNPTALKTFEEKPDGVQTMPCF